MSRRFGTSQLQSAIYNAIIGLGYSCYDEVPEKKTFPYVVIRSITSNNSDLEDKTNFGRDNSVDLDIWSRKPGFLEIQTISEAILGVISSLSISNFSVIHFNYTLDLERDPDGLTRRGLVDIQFDLDQTS